MKKIIKKAVVFSLLCIYLISCKEAEKAQEIILDVKVSRADVESSFTQVPYTEVQQKIFSQYFRGIANLAIMLKQSSDKASDKSKNQNTNWDKEDDFDDDEAGFDEDFDDDYVPMNFSVQNQFDINSLCEDLIIAPSTWTSIKNNCFLGEYFICSEEIRSFDQSLSAIFNNLDDVNKSKFKTNKLCSQWMPLIKVSLRGVNNVTNFK